MPNEDVRKTITLILVIFALCGLILIGLSLWLRYLHESQLLSEMLKELGIVLLAVFTVSLVYEYLLAEKHLEQFQALLRQEIKQTDTNAAACAQLGITRIFLTRDDYVRAYPFQNLLSHSSATTKIKIIAVTLSQILNKPDDLKHALNMGADIRLCMLNPEVAKSSATGLPDLYSNDIELSLTQFKMQIAGSIRSTPLDGRLELRLHNFPLFHSYAVFKLADQQLGSWDLSFGRTTDEKRVFLVDPSGPLGTDLSKRFDPIWEAAKPIFLLEDKLVKIDSLLE